MNLLIIYLAGILIVPLLIPPIDEQELGDVITTWIAAFLWPLIALTILAILLLIAGFAVILSIAYTLIVVMCHILTPK